jgi:hypothetical protein
MAFHCELTGLDIHVINTWTYANSAARDAATGFTADDVYKVAIQTDNNSIWMLVDHSPITWKKIATEDDIASLVTDFLSLTDTPSAYTGYGGKVVAVKVSEDGLEFITVSHDDLDDLLNDVHTQYMPTDASRAFTQPVSGQDPTLDNHLATKLYTDAASANALAQALAADIDTFTGLTDTPSGYSGKSLQLVRVNAGETALEFAPSGTGGVAALDTEYATSEGVSSTTSTTYQQKLRLTTSNLAAGTYMIQYNWEFDGDNNHGWSRVQLNDTTDLAEDRYDSSQISYIIISGFAIQSLSGVNTIDIDFRANIGGDTMLIRRARIALWRIS